MTEFYPAAGEGSAGVGLVPRGGPAGHRRRPAGVIVEEHQFGHVGALRRQARGATAQVPGEQRVTQADASTALQQKGPD
ncbi:hypothetical protein, partial [Streptomyces erythrochromogenes]|uniref:hypothetical protein n=1 Tax=Streptomyces erythrochromogenes TaxID=285574 RepID=UPI0036A325BC